MENRKIDFSTTIIEYKLKQALNQRPDIKDKILTGDELGQYIEWMISTFGSSESHSLKGLNEIPCSNKLIRLSKNLLEDPMDNAAKDELIDIYGCQNETSFFTPGIDISVSKQIRFMPSHWHSNDYFEFYYNMGSSNIRISFPEEVVSIKKGDILIVSTSAVHACETTDENDNILFFMIRKSTFQDVFWNQLPKDSLMANFFRQVITGGSTTSYLHFETEDDTEIEDLLTSIYFESQKDSPYKGQMLNALMSTFFVFLLRNHEDSVKLPRTKDFYWSQEFSAIISYIETNFTTLSLASLSKKFNYSEKQISRIVYKYVGIPYSDLILQLKMKRAAYLLSDDSLTIEQIGLMVGYSTTSSFYRAFESYYKMTPLQYRVGKIEKQ